MYLIKSDNLQALLDKWSQSFKLIVPANENGSVMFLPYEKDAFTMDYINPCMPAKEFLFEQKESLFNWKIDGTLHIMRSNTNKLEDRIIFGVRACDAYAAAYLDRFYIEEYRDTNYAERRENSYIVAVNCINPGKNCFCTSTGIGPFAKKGYDLSFTPLGEDYLVELGSQKGKKLIEPVKHLLTETSDYILAEKEVLQSIVEDKFIRTVNLLNMPYVMEATFDSGIWKEISKACIGCTGCTNVCPTCTCFNIVEEQPCYNEGCRVRCWDSCQSDSFTRNAGNHNPRNEISRVRYRIYDKLKYIEERFQYKGCTGCGRCIEVCPSLIDIIEIASKLKNEYKVGIENKRKKAGSFEICGSDHHERCEHIYTPQAAIIKDIIQETRDIKRFIVEYEDKTLHDNYKFMGQFFELTIFGVGEIAISIPFGPSQRDYFDFCVKKCGRVTNAMHELKAGDKLGLRGPFGKGFPYEEMKGRDILIIGSGVGLAPVRTMIVRIIENLKEFGKLVIIASATSYEGLVYKEDLIKWSDIEGVGVYYALSRHTDKVQAHVGYINDLLPNLDFDWKNSTSIICASPRRIKAVAKDLLSLGMEGKDILTSLETHMRCGIGKCGHCKVGNKYMCVDGPVFNYDEMLALPQEF